ncbi:TPA: lipase maturation factor family protein [Candidatus Poribacteria bacterium]|nr:lipase maturation factor family protein [Candidatus Poribacteria bacterium]HIM11242.1 lipase maturation factor family protein [Candidatus Poribacteria bacterium]
MMDLLGGKRKIRFLSTLTRWLGKANSNSPTYFISRWLFLRILGLVYFIAFLSLWVQIDGLVGSNGILPIKDYLDTIRDNFGNERYRLWPTVFWLNGSDGALHFVCGLGLFLSVLLISGCWAPIALFCLWICYLSLVVAGQDFLSFQWDILLLETGFLAIFLAPFQNFPKLSCQSSPSASVLWLHRWLLFRLIFASGYVKLSSGDETWKNLTALNYHYETQPLPTLIGWYVHHFPEWFQKFSVSIMFGIELFIPFCIFLPRRCRAFAGGVLIILQILIASTGNYCFFNLLTIILCFLLFDDISLHRILPQKLTSRFPHSLREVEERTIVIRKLHFGCRSILVTMLVIFILLISGIRMAGMLFRYEQLPSFTLRILRWTAPFHTVNGYGLFANMTTSRPEIIIEGSNDGENWRVYQFRWKPGNLDRPPRTVAPHQPRLDWQMWFAALSNYRRTPWFGKFIEKLLLSSPEVLGLLLENPFPDDPPRYIRAKLYDYKFTDWETNRGQGDWWQRTEKGLYLSIVSLR